METGTSGVPVFFFLNTHVSAVELNCPPWWRSSWWKENLKVSRIKKGIIVSAPESRVCSMSVMQRGFHWEEKSKFSQSLGPCKRVICKCNCFMFPACYKRPAWTVHRLLWNATYNKTCSPRRMEREPKKMLCKRWEGRSRLGWTI